MLLLTFCMWLCEYNISSNTWATWCKEPTHKKRPWCWGEGLKEEREGDNRGWDGWMASPTWWTWVWPSSRRWWRTGKPGVLQSMGSQRVGHDWATEQNNILITLLPGKGMQISSPITHATKNTLHQPLCDCWKPWNTSRESSCHTQPRPSCRRHVCVQRQGQGEKWGHMELWNAVASTSAIWYLT